MVEFDAPIPILRIFSVEKAVEFYVGFLGFTLDWQEQPADPGPVFMQVSRGGVKFYLTEHHGDACPGSTVTVPTEGIEEYLEELSAKHYAYYQPAIEETPWNTQDIAVTDPFGNQIRFSEAMQSS
jgi:catechol 2,3-dioxygenase-like lactoylglutathione lyase family enzyme